MTIVFKLCIVDFSGYNHLKKLKKKNGKNSDRFFYFDGEMRAYYLLLKTYDFFYRLGFDFEIYPFVSASALMDFSTGMS